MFTHRAWNHIPLKSHWIDLLSGRQTFLQYRQGMQGHHFYSLGTHLAGTFSPVRFRRYTDSALNFLLFVASSIITIYLMHSHTRRTITTQPTRCQIFSGTIQKNHNAIDCEPQRFCMWYDLVYHMWGLVLVGVAVFFSANVGASWYCLQTWTQGYTQLMEFDWQTVPYIQCHYYL